MVRYAIIAIMVLLCSSQKDYVHANANQEIVKAVETALENKFGQMISMLSTGRDNFLHYTQSKMEALEQKCSRCLNTTEIAKTLHEQTLTELTDIKGTMVQEIQSLKDKILSFEKMIGCENSHEKKITDNSGLKNKTVDEDQAQITQVMPDKLQLTTATKLSLIINKLPSGEGSLQCVFSTLYKDLVTKANRTDQGVSCNTPASQFLPDIPHGEHHFVSTLSVRKNEGPGLVNTNFTFFDCNTYSSCTGCVSSPFPCAWCVDGHRCTHNSAENCRNDVLVYGVNQVAPSIRVGPSFCPRITPIESPEILMPVGTNMTISVKVENMAQFITQERFVCQFLINGRRSSFNANLLDDIIYCEDVDFYMRAAPSTIATLNVIWGGTKTFDNTDNIHVVLYQCNLMADNCGECMSLPEQFRCGWCMGMGNCEVTDQCSGQVTWLSKNDTCHNN